MVRIWPTVCLDVVSQACEVAPVERTQQVYTPRWSPDGRKVAYSMHRAGGYRDLYVYDREAGTHARITADRFLDMTPAYTPDGRWLLYSSDRDGVLNVYALELESGRTWQVTNVLGAAFDATPRQRRVDIVDIGAAKNLSGLGGERNGNGKRGDQREDFVHGRLNARDRVWCRPHAPACHA